MTDAEHPEDEQRNEEEEAQASAGEPEAPGDDAQAPADEAQAPGEEAQAPAEEEQTPGEEAQAPAEEEQTPAEEPAPSAEEQTPAAAESADAPAQAPTPTAEAEQPPTPAGATEAGATPTADEAPAEEIEIEPRQRPEIPGADLIPDIVSESDDFLDAEARAAAEAEAEEAAKQDQDSDQDEARPIADAAIDLAAGARYTATGKRKTAVARVILKPGTGTYSINGKNLDSFFPRDTLRRVIRQPLEAVGYEARMDVVARMHGGGVSAQAGALRHGISRALIVADPNLRGELKRRGFLTRDPRVKERKKAGLKKARKRPQFSKR